MNKTSQNGTKDEKEIQIKVKKFFWLWYLYATFQWAKFHNEVGLWEIKKC